VRKKHREKRPRRDTILQPKGPEHTFRVGQSVQAQWPPNVEAQGSLDWWRGAINAVNRDGTYGVRYEDGDIYESVDHSMIRDQTPKQAKPPRRRKLQHVVEDKTARSSAYNIYHSSCDTDPSGLTGLLAMLPDAAFTLRTVSRFSPYWLFGVVLKDQNQ
jgi:hypothetical protein